MIKNKEEIKRELKDDISKIIDKYVEDMDKNSNEEKFPIDKIERMLGGIIGESKKVIIDKTTELLSNIDEENEIKKTEYAESGIKLQNHGMRNIQITTLYGKLEIERTMLYDRKTKESVMPKDEYIEITGLPFAMTKAMMTETAFYGQNQTSFGAASDMIQRAMGLEINRETVRQVSEYVGGKVHDMDTERANEAYRNAGEIESADGRGGTLYIMMDGATVNTRIEDEAGSTWRENKLVLVFSDRYILEQKNRNNIILKKEYAAYVGSVDEFKKHVYRAALENEYGAYEQVVVIGDGATWIRNMCNELFPNAQQILDKYHLCEHIYDYAKTLFNNSADKYTPWAETVIEKIENGKVSEALDMIEENAKNSDGAVKLTKYLQNNMDKIDYKYYEEQGWFVGSGAIESGNKVVLQRRLKQAGMRWGVDAAQSIVTLRAKWESRLWERDVVGLICS